MQHAVDLRMRGLWYSPSRNSVSQLLKPTPQIQDLLTAVSAKTGMGTI
jgi:hypothetical protein